MISRKKGSTPTTTIRLLPREKQLIRLAAAFLNERYQVYMKRVVLENAAGILNSTGLLHCQVKTATERKITFIDE